MQKFRSNMLPPSSGAKTQDFYNKIIVPIVSSFSFYFAFQSTKAAQSDTLKLVHYICNHAGTVHTPIKA
jgi:hypothetical protein